MHNNYASRVRTFQQTDFVMCRACILEQTREMWMLLRHTLGLLPETGPFWGVHCNVHTRGLVDSVTQGEGSGCQCSINMTGLLLGPFWGVHCNVHTRGLVDSVTQGEGSGCQCSINTTGLLLGPFWGVHCNVHTRGLVDSVTQGEGSGCQCSINTTGLLLGQANLVFTIGSFFHLVVR